MTYWSCGRFMAMLASSAFCLSVHESGLVSISDFRLHLSHLLPPTCFSLTLPVKHKLVKSHLQCDYPDAQIKDVAAYCSCIRASLLHTAVSAPSHLDRLFSSSRRPQSYSPKHSLRRTCKRVGDRTLSMLQQAFRASPRSLHRSSRLTRP